MATVILVTRLCRSRRGINPAVSAWESLSMTRTKLESRGPTAVVVRAIVAAWIMMLTEWVDIWGYTDQTSGRLAFRRKRRHEGGGARGEAVSSSSRRRSSNNNNSPCTSCCLDSQFPMVILLVAIRAPSTVGWLMLSQIAAATKEMEGAVIVTL